MGLYTREDHERDVRELNAQQVKINRLLVSCVWCGVELSELPGLMTVESVQGLNSRKGANRFVYNPEVLEEITRKRAEITCPGCGKPRHTALDAATWQAISDQIDKAIEACDGRLVGTALRIQETRAMQKDGWFAWVIGATKEHEQGCAKLRDEQYCTCDGVWRITRAKGPLIKFRSGTFRASSFAELMNLQARGVTLMESWPRRKEREDVEDAEADAQDTEPQWVRVPIAEYDRYQCEGRWRAMQHSPNVTIIAWEARWMTRLIGSRATAEYFEAMEVWNDGPTRLTVLPDNS